MERRSACHGVGVSVYLRTAKRGLLLPGQLIPRQPLADDLAHENLLRDQPHTPRSHDAGALIINPLACVAAIPADHARAALAGNAVASFTWHIVLPAREQSPG